MFAISSLDPLDMFYFSVWSTPRSSEARLSGARDSQPRPLATPPTSVLCNNRRRQDNSRPSVFTDDPGNLSRQGRALERNKYVLIILCCNFQIISEFDKPGSFQPMKASYNKQQFEPTTEKSFVSGPPLGKQSKIYIVHNILDHELSINSNPLFRR